MSDQEKQHIEDQKLWSSFITGDDDSLAQIYRRYFDELYRYGKNWLGDPLLVEDSIQDLFIKLMKNRSSLSTGVTVKYYLFRSLRSVVLDKLRAGSKMKMIDTPGDQLFLLELSPETRLVDEQEERLLKNKMANALQQLTPRQREVIFLRYSEGFSYQEIASAMELTAKGTYKLMARAIESLREHLTSIAILFSLII